jgi:hypothetical protein
MTLSVVSTYHNTPMQQAAGNERFDPFLASGWPYY